MGRALACAALLTLCTCCTALRAQQPTKSRSDADAASSLVSVQAPRGWNSYNGWGGAVNETVLLAVADFVQARSRLVATPPPTDVAGSMH